MKRILILILGLWSVAQAQTTGYFRYDSVRFEKVGGNSEFILLNGTRAVTGGVLTNTGNGRTAFVAPGSLVPAWLLTGNAGTTVGTNFLGTTDNKGLMFKTNNVQSGYIDLVNSNTSFGKGTLINFAGLGLGQCNAFGYLALNSLTGDNTGAGQGNNAFGNEALTNATLAIGNNAFGRYALTNLIDGEDNVGVGDYAGNKISHGGFNIMIGDQSALQVRNGNYNVSVGSNSWLSDRDTTTFGSYNTFLGTSAGYNNSSGSYNIALGDSAGAFNGQLSNRLYISSIPNRNNIGEDTTRSIIYGAQSASATSQRLYFNSQVYLPYANSGVGTKAVRINPGTGLITYADTTISAISGSGTTNYIAKWTPNGTTLGNSQIFDNGTNVGIGTTSPSYQLHVVGATNGAVSFDNTASRYSDVYLSRSNTAYGIWRLDYTGATISLGSVSGANALNLTYGAFNTGLSINGSTGAVSVPVSVSTPTLTNSGGDLTVTNGSANTNYASPFRHIFSVSGADVATNIAFFGWDDVSRNIVAFGRSVAIAEVGSGARPSPVASAILDVQSTTKGFLPPRMTGAQAEAISSPADGLMIYCNNGNGSTVNSTGWWGYSGGWTKIH